MKNMAVKISAFIVALWYCVSIIGFDVHHCAGSGRSFVATFLTGLTCADIHPEHHCSHSHCCADEGHHDCCGAEAEESFGPSSCCTNDFQVLLLTGTSGSDDDRHENAMTLQYMCALTSLPADVHVSAGSYLGGYPKIPDSGLIVPEDIQSVLGIWRI